MFSRFLNNLVHEVLAMFTTEEHKQRMATLRDDIEISEKAASERCVVRFLDV